MKRVWLRADVILAMHSEQLAEHGGGGGVRDHGLLDSALARPEDLAAYGEPSPFELAAAYAFGIAKNHPFVDGNKRAGFLAAAIFLELNGDRFIASETDVVTQTLALAAGEVSEKEFAFWLKANCKAV